MRIDDPHAQQRIDSVPLLNVHLNPRSRDETVKLIRGLQGVYADEPARQAVLGLIARDVLRGARRDVGRPGMDMWSVFVLLSAREALRLDYDRLEDLAENHALIRAAMGLGDWEQGQRFDWTRIWRNVRKVRAETVAEINRRVLQLGHTLAPTAAESARVDSFVMQTNVVSVRRLSSADHPGLLACRAAATAAGVMVARSCFRPRRCSSSVGVTVAR